jgi:hypothetical protein
VAPSLAKNAKTGSFKNALRIDDAFELVDRLTEYLTALPAADAPRQ